MTSKPPVLILGGSGFIGTALEKRFLGTCFSTSSKGNSRYKFSILDDDLEPILKSNSFTFAIFLIGISDTIFCAKNSELSYQINVTKSIAIFQLLQKYNIKIIYISTDLIFDGQHGNYIETDEPNPLLTYAKHKLDCEKFLNDKSENYLILRSTKIIAFAKNNLLNTWYQKVCNGETIHLAFDTLINPISRNNFINLLVKAIQNNLKGTFHVGGLESFSHFDLFMNFIKINRLKPQNNTIIPRSMNEILLPEVRPLNTTLNYQLISKTLSIELDKTVDLLNISKYKDF